MNAMEMNVRFLYFKDCPNAEAALQRLREVLLEEGLSDDVELVEVRSQEEVERYHFLGSPTIQINGLDIEKERRADHPCLAVEYIKGRKGTPVYHPRI